MSSAGDFDYDRLGERYTHVRRTDPRIARQIHDALGSARTVLNVGAGAGSYEPTDRYVLPIEPSAVMRAQRSPMLAPAIAATAAALPLDDQSLDAAMAALTIHHWPDLRAGLREVRRVTRGPIVILTADRDALERFWLVDYAPELIAVEHRRYPPIQDICDGLEGRTDVQTVLIPIDCVDGFTEAFYARPEAFLRDEVRLAQSAWGFVSADDQAAFVAKLRDDLLSGAWDERYGQCRTTPEFEGSMRLLISHPD